MPVWRLHMQRSYFLGGSSAEGFETAFWKQHSDSYGFYLKGGPGTGKSTLMKKLAAAFPDENISVYHCASDPHSLDAIVFEDRNVFVADATAPHESSTPLPYITGELVDLAAGLRTEKLKEYQDGIRNLYQANQNEHRKARKGLLGITAMLDTIAETGEKALIPNKLSGYAARLTKRIIKQKRGQKRSPEIRPCCAVTPLGKMTLLPDEYEWILLHDDALAASQALLKQMSEIAASTGEICEITQSLTQSSRPVTHLLFPQIKLAIISEQAITLSELKKPILTVNMQRFYQSDLLKQQKSILRFCSKTASVLEQETVSILAKALRIHDELEAGYIRALNKAFLDKKASELTKKIQSYPLKTA